MMLGLFCGGYSSEFEISMKSASTIAQSLPPEIEVVQIVVRRGQWTAMWNDKEFDFDLNSLAFVDGTGITRSLEAGLVYVHGDPGENGKIQALLEMKGLPCVNSGALASELSFDKWYCNQFLRGFDIPVAESILFTHPFEHQLQDCIDQLGLPLFVKPCDSGSSFGVTKVKKPEELRFAIDQAFVEGETVVLEAFLDGREVTCGVYRNHLGAVALPLTEIVSESEYFDYAAKYLGKSQEITPARLEAELTEKVQQMAVKVYQILRLRSIARIDFMVVNENPFLIEVNTTPGFSPASIVPQMLQCEGIDLQRFWRDIIQMECPQLLKS